jgi:hypothetical protein
VEFNSNLKKQIPPFCFHFSIALEQFFLLSEIESFFHVSPQLTSSLQRWILARCKQIFKSEKNLFSKTQLEEMALDVLEWAPMESMVEF